MGVGKFVLYFIISLLVGIFILDNSPNNFVSGFLIALAFGVVGSAND